MRRDDVAHGLVIEVLGQGLEGSRPVAISASLGATLQLATQSNDEQADCPLGPSVVVGSVADGSSSDEQATIIPPASSRRTTAIAWRCMRECLALIG